MLLSILAQSLKLQQSKFIKSQLVQNSIHDSILFDQIKCINFQNGVVFMIKIVLSFLLIIPIIASPVLASEELDSDTERQAMYRKTAAITHVPWYYEH